VTLVFGQDARVHDFVVRHVPHMGPMRDYAAIGVADDGGRLVAGCLYHNYVPDYGVIEMSIAATTPRWARRDVIRSLLAYPLVQLDCRRVTAVCPSDNARAIRFNLGLGFTREGTLRHFFAPKRHAVVLGFLKADFQRLFVKE
jgi:RimJ/RimL family protein N-acetyltransferase